MGGSGGGGGQGRCERRSEVCENSKKKWGGGGVGSGGQFEKIQERDVHAQPKKVARSMLRVRGQI